VSRGRLVAALALCAALGVPAAASDTLCLKDGRIFDNVTLQRGEGAILVKFQNGQVAVPLEKVLECVIENDTGFVPQTEAEKQKVAEGLVLFQGKWVKPNERDARLKKLVAEQRATVEKLKQSRLWRNRVVADTKTFSVEYTVPPPVYTDKSELMEAYYAEFVKRWKIKRPRDLGKLKVRFYAEPDDFYQVTGVSRGTLAFFEYAEPPYRLQFYFDRLDPVGVERDMLHEFGHYLQGLIEPGFHYPHWPGEALAEYYSTASFDRGTKKITIEPLVLEERLIEIQRDIEEGERVGLEELVRGGNDGNYHDYTWGWSLIHFLMSKPDTAKSFESFYIGLARSRAVEREGYSAFKNLRIDRVESDEMLALFKKEMGLKKDSDVRALEVAWHDYVQRDIAVSSSRGLARAARMATRFGRQHRAKRLYEEAIAAGDADALTHHRYAELLEDMKELEGARGQWAKAVELDPLVPEFYIAWGECLLDEAKSKDEGKRLLKLAQEIEPENLYLEQNLEELLAK
jgi:tetratricopeptide (TPR) repeat protein